MDLELQKKIADVIQVWFLVDLVLGGVLLDLLHLRGELLAHGVVLLPVGGPVDEVLEDGDDDKEVRQTLH